MAKFRAKEVSDLVRPVPLTVGNETFVVFLRHITRHQDQALIRAASHKVLNRRSGKMEDETDGEVYSRLYCEQVFGELEEAGQKKTGWEGLTPTILNQLVEFDDGTAPKPVMDKGTDGREREVIAYDPELAQFLWFNARPADFADPIFNNSQRMLELAEAERAARRKN